MIGIVVGLAAEARIAAALGGRVAIGGGSGAGAADAAAALIQAGARYLVSFGLAGGLAPGLPAGTVVVPVRVADQARSHWLADPELSARLGAPMHTLLAVESVIALASAKHDLWRQSGAVAADMESGAVAAAAAQAGLGFAVLRVICDPAGRDLPPAALTALDAAGQIRPGALLRSLARRPAQLPTLIALGRDAASARRALLARVASIGPLVPP